MIWLHFIYLFIFSILNLAQLSRGQVTMWHVAGCALFQRINCWVELLYVIGQPFLINIVG